MSVNTVFSIPRKITALKDNVEVVVKKLSDLIYCTDNLNNLKNKSAEKNVELQACLAILKGMINEINTLGSKPTIRYTN